MKKSIAFILLCLFSQALWGQIRTPFRLKHGLSKDAILPGTIVVKLKAKSTNSLNNKSSRISSISIGPEVLNTEIKKLGTKDVRKVFKNNKSSLSKIGSEQIDLSNIYFLKIDPTLDLEASINFYFKTKM